MIPINEPLLSGREMEYVQNCIQTSWISSAGQYINRFERDWARFCNRKHGVAVSNGSVALTLAISALDLSPGSEVILPSFTIVSCLEAVLQNNLKPVLVDCDPHTYCMDMNDVEKKITENTTAIMPVHIYGHPVNMEALIKIANIHSLKIIEDAAEAHGSECRVDGEWKRCGSFGEVSTFSFYANKNITCGEGGMVLTNDDEIAERLRSRRNLCFGNQSRFHHEDRGWNFRITNMQAAIGCAQLEKIDHFIARKIDMMNRYNEGLKDLAVQTPYIEKWAHSSVWMYAIVLNDSVQSDAKDFAMALEKKGIQTRPFFLGMHEQSVYLERDLVRISKCPVTERIAKRGLYLPSGQAITNEQIEIVISSVRGLLK
jgi:perosamine synthetase